MLPCRERPEGKGEGAVSRIADCVADIVQICAGGDAASAIKNARMRIDKFYIELGVFLKDKPQQDGSSEVGKLVDELRAASTKAAKQNAHGLSDNIDQSIAYARAAKRC